MEKISGLGLKKCGGHAKHLHHEQGRALVQQSPDERPEHISSYTYELAAKLTPKSQPRDCQLSGSLGLR